MKITNKNYITNNKLILPVGAILVDSEHYLIGRASWFSTLEVIWRISLVLFGSWLTFGLVVIGVLVKVDFSLDSFLEVGSKMGPLPFFIFFWVTVGLMVNLIVQGVLLLVSSGDLKKIEFRKA